MDRPCQLLMQAMKAALNNEKVDWDMEISREEWISLLRMAETHRVLPMVFQAVYDCPAARRLDPAFFGPCRSLVRQMVMIQLRKTADFLPLLEKLRKAGAEPLVVKGIVCRNLYPNPDYRMSSDEDLLILPEKFDACHRCMTEYGMTTPDPEADAYEVPYFQEQGVLYIEAHKALFPEENKAYGDWNRFFRDVRQRAVVQDGIPTMAPTDHILYLIFHAFKHFLHSGFGIRQVCDMILYANAYGSQIDWDYVLDCCRQIRADKFAAAVFRIGWKHLGYSPEAARYPLRWREIDVNEMPLLEDILMSGIYGDADMSRKHSSNMTLQAVAVQKGSSRNSGVMKSLFPSAKDLQGRYPYLKEKPILLPVAWVDRILKYSKETRNLAGNDPGESIRIGNRRIELLKRYGVIDKK